MELYFRYAIGTVEGKQEKWAIISLADSIRLNFSVNQKAGMIVVWGKYKKMRIFKKLVDKGECDED